MRLTLSAILLSLLYFATDCARKKKCFAIKGRYYFQDDGEAGKCRRCEACSAGMEWDENAIIRTSPEYGDLECLPCVPCADGYYKDNNVFYSCSPCVQNCEGLNRYLQVPCGGVIKGHCGSCKQGYEDEMGNIEMACTPIALETGSKNPNGVDFSFQPLDSGSKKLFPRSKTSATSNWPTDKVILVVGIVSGSISALVCLIGGILFVTVNKRRQIRDRQNDRNQAEDYSSSKRLLQSNQSMRSVQVPIPADPERPEIVHDLDIECDVYPLPADVPVRGELQSTAISIGSCETGDAARTCTQYPNNILSKVDNILAIIASHVYGDNVIEKLSSRLNIPKQKCYEERQLWLTKQQSLKQFVLNVLLKWVEKEGPGATLSNLCEALHCAGCLEALTEVNKELQHSSTVS